MEEREPIAVMWIGLLSALDVVFITLALWAFEPVDDRVVVEEREPFRRA